MSLARCSVLAPMTECVLCEGSGFFGATPLDRPTTIAGRTANARGHPIPIVAPDPRHFGLHKLWLSERPKRDAAKRGKDREQGTRVLRIVKQKMPQYPMGDDFVATLPAELARYIRA